jgi:hypothetical protein
LYGQRGIWHSFDVFAVGKEGKYIWNGSYIFTGTELLHHSPDPAAEPMGNSVRYGILSVYIRECSEEHLQRKEKWVSAGCGG